LAMTECQSTIYQLTHRHREQARSHTSPLPHLITLCPVDLCVEIFAAQNFHTSSKTILPALFSCHGPSAPPGALRNE
ncbi:hypothetical protein, partial [Pseudomonas gessardii]|uniref:hypothetical protein n=1 Tax=Pseudomonas gessardii TaxID=78544 RepID=UPI001E5731E0